MKPIHIDRLQGKRRFWQQVEVVSSDKRKDNPKVSFIALDGRVVVAPSENPLSCPTQELAEAICMEWRAVEETCALEDMPLTRLLVTTTEAEADPVFFHRLIHEMVSYVHDDVLFYQVAHPSDLAHRQGEVWTPLLDWAHEILGVPCHVTTSVMPIYQDDAYVDAIKTTLCRMTTFDLTAFQAVARGCQSLITGLAVVMEHLTPDQAFEAAFLDEIYQNDRWGVDTLTVKRRASVRAELTNAARFVFLARRQKSREEIYSCAAVSL